MQTQNTKTPKFSLQSILMVACAVLLLAVIVVSAFAYTWRRDQLAAEKKVKTLQMEISSVESLTTELSNLRLENAQLSSELDNTARELANLKASVEADDTEADATAAPDAE